jgi:glycine/D-amino acid oxidase-like deaminating enzyme
VIVVGAGAAGLGAATALAERGPVTVVDRVPVPGGCVRYDHPDVRAAYDAARRAGVTFRLGATATRFEAGRLLLCAPGAIGWERCDTLVFAGGLRPATAAELGLTGDRPAGVLPVTVAKHLLEADPALWRRVAIVGAGPGAAQAAALVIAGGGTVTWVAPPAPRPAGAAAPRDRGEPRDAAGVPHDVAEAPHRGGGAAPRDAGEPRAVAVAGRARVSGLRTDRGVVPCDAVLLAADPRPVRNVDGAIAEDAPGVVYVQDVPAGGFAATVRAAAALVRAPVAA